MISLRELSGRVADIDDNQEGDENRDQAWNCEDVEVLRSHKPACWLAGHIRYIVLTLCTGGIKKCTHGCNRNCKDLRNMGLTVSFS